MPSKKSLQIVALLLLCCASTMALAQAVRVEHNIAVNQTGGWHPWYEAHIDPDNAQNMMICGSKWSAKDNASYGFVYYSADAGKTWQQALEDKSSAWVSEESCAYGANGMAYFVADASKVIDGELHHELGTTHIYASHDAGRNWKLGIETGWCDYSTLVVDMTPGPNQNRLYVYFNAPWTFYNSLGEKDAADAEKKASPTNRVGFISYKDGDAKVAGPFTSAEMAKENYHGSYPAPALMLKDGSIVTIYTAKRRIDKGREFMVESVRTGPDRTSLEAPVKVVDSLDNPDADPTVNCGGYYLGSAAAYDPVHDKLYYAYSDVRDKTCHLFLTTSVDGGKSWAKAQQVYTSQTNSGTIFESLSIAVNKDGVLAMTWEKSPRRSGCWMFATSSDDGRSITTAKELGTCSAEEMKPSLLNSDYLWTSFFQAAPQNPTGAARINLRNTRNGGGPHEDGIAVSVDGDFHPVWTDAGHGEGELRTAEIHVIPAAALIANATPGLTDVTNKLAVLYAGNQFYDAKTKLITLDVMIKNNSDQSFTGPFKLAVPDLYKDYGFAEIANADNQVSGPGAVWDISTTIPGGTLAPGAISKPFALKFRYLADEDTPRDSDDILGLSVKIFAAK